MTAQLVGNVSVGQYVPTALSLNAQLLAELQGKLAAALNIQAALTIQLPGLSAQLEGALAVAASLQAMLSAGLTVTLPGVSLSIEANLAVIAELTAQISALLALQIALGTAGVYVITHEGPSETHGPEVQAIVSDIAPAGNVVYSVTMLATVPAVYAALGAVILTG
jgi:hypothetical protein